MRETRGEQDLKVGTGWQWIEGDGLQALGNGTQSSLVTKRFGGPQITKSGLEVLENVSTWRTAAAVTPVLGARWTSPRVKEDPVLSFWSIQSFSPSNIQVRMLGSYSIETLNFCSIVKFYTIFFFQNGNQNKKKDSLVLGLFWMAWAHYGKILFQMNFSYYHCIKWTQYKMISIL